MSDETDSSVILRAFIPQEDEPFIYSSWRNALWFSEKRDDKLSDDFYSYATQQIKSLLKDPATTIRVAILADLPVLTVGFSVMQGQHLHWVYVKIDYRRRGIGKLLTPHLGSISQPMTKVGKAIAEQKKLEIKENHGKETKRRV